MVTTGFWTMIPHSMPGCYNVATEFHQEVLRVPLPQTEAPGRLQAELMSRGLRMTRQRRTILSVVEMAKQHLDASQILRRARKLDPHEQPL
jgi:hypothetical protein